MPRLLLVRHGESEWNAIGRWQGRADPPLSGRGRRQATLAAEVLGAMDAIVTSTLQRAAETAAIIGRGLGVGPPVLEPDLQERDAGPWEGLTRIEIEASWPGFLADRRRPAGYELDDELVDRALGAIDRVCRKVIADELLVVTHGGVINALEGSFGCQWQRVPNLGGRWFAWQRGHLSMGERVELVDHELLTYQERDQV